MPLVTRTATTGGLFRQSDEPPNWLNGDLWVDTDDGTLSVNIDGTASKIQGTRTVLGDYEAAEAEATTTISFDAIDFDNDSEILVVLDGSVTGALSLQMRLNGDATANYSTDGRRIAAGVETLINLNTQTSAFILGSALLSAADRTFNGRVTIGLEKGVAADFPGMNSIMYSSTLRGQEVSGNRLAVDTSSISSVTILTSASTWKIGTRFTVYKLTRA